MPSGSGRGLVLQHERKGPELPWEQWAEPSSKAMGSQWTVLGASILLRCHLIYISKRSLCWKQLSIKRWLAGMETSEIHWQISSAGLGDGMDARGEGQRG